MAIFSPKTALFGVLVPVLLASPSVTPFAFAGPDAPAVDRSHSTDGVGSAAVITALGALGLVFTFAGSHGHSDGVTAPAEPGIIASIAAQPSAVAPIVPAPAARPIPLLWPSQTPASTADVPAGGGTPTPGAPTFFLSPPSDTAPTSPGGGNGASSPFMLTLPQDADQAPPLGGDVLFATPEPSTWTAFVFMALCGGGTMLCSRRREAV